MPTSDQQYDINLANRQIEINDWSYNNKMDTLFVFQILFISILFVSILAAFKQMGMIGSAFVWYTLFIIVILVVLIIINRSMYTNNTRDSRHWNKRHFGDDNMKASPIGLDNPSLGDYMKGLKSKFGSSSESDCACNS
jgi:hypothetical protein